MGTRVRRRLHGTLHARAFLRRRRVRAQRLNYFACCDRDVLAQCGVLDRESRHVQDVLMLAYGLHGHFKFAVVHYAVVFIRPWSLAYAL